MNRSRAASRRLAIRRLVGRRAVGSQEELVALLESAGHRVTQTTVSRDLTALGARKVDGPGGRERYVLGNGAESDAAGSLGRMVRDFVVGITAAQNLVVVRTPPGSAAPVASALDADPPDGVVGTVAGDDTILVVTGSSRDAAAVVRGLEQLMEA
jgi:transcriptional regulator of arginine metabolism